MWSFLFISNHLQASGWELARQSVLDRRGPQREAWDFHHGLLARIMQEI